MLIMLALTSYISHLLFLLPLRLWTVFLHDLLQQCLLLPKSTQTAGGTFADHQALQHIGYTCVALENSSTAGKKKKEKKKYFSPSPPPHLVPTHLPNIKEHS